MDQTPVVQRQASRLFRRGPFRTPVLSFLAERWRQVAAEADAISARMQAGAGRARRLR